MKTNLSSLRVVTLMAWQMLGNATVAHSGLVATATCEVRAVVDRAGGQQVACIDCFIVVMRIGAILQRNCIVSLARHLFVVRTRASVVRTLHNLVSWRPVRDWELHRAWRLTVHPMLVAFSA